MTPEVPVPMRERIEQEARDAAAKGAALRDACPYPFTSEAGLHFAAVYLLALPKESNSND